MRGVWLVLTVAACRELSPLPPDVCGNGVVDPGEDCDGDRSAGLACAAPSDARACHYVCGGAACPAGWACGGDGVCRHATGELVFSTTAALSHDELTIADVDGDGAGEVIGFDARGAHVLFGEASVVAASPDQLTGPGTTGDLDGDGRADIVVPFVYGLAVARGEGDRSVTPVGYAPFVAGRESWFVPVRLDDAHGDALVLLNLQNTGTLAAMLAVPDPSDQPPSVLVTDVPPSALGATVARVDLDAPSQEDELVVVAPGKPQVWSLQPRALPSGSFGVAVATIDLPLGAVSDGRILAVDVDGDGHRDVVLGTLTAAGYGIALARNTGTWPPQVQPSLALDAIAATLSAPAAASDVPSAPQAFPLALGDFDGDGRLDAVSPDAIFTTAVHGTLEPTFRRATAAPWREAVIVRRGSARDVVVASYGPALDVLRAGTSGGFTRVPIDTQGPAALLRVGNFDGDAYDDVAFREHDSDGDRVRVLFGGEGPLAASIAAVGAPAIARLEVGRFRDYRGVEDAADDLVAIVGDALGGRVALVAGAGDRRLSSPLFLARGADFDRPLGVVAGHFTTAGPERDLAVLATDRNGARRLWLFPATAGAAYTVRGATVLTGSALGALAQISLRKLAAVDLDGDGRDELVALGAGTAGANLVTMKFPAVGSPVAHDFALDIGSPLDLAAGDLDGDGRAELVIAGSAGMSRWHEGALASLPLTGSSVCLAQLDADPALEIVVLDRGTLSIVDSATFAVRKSAAVPASTLMVRAGDLDGDGVADLVIGDGTTITRVLAQTQVPR